MAGYSQTRSDTLMVLAKTFNIHEVEQGFATHGILQNTLLIICTSSNEIWTHCPEKYTVDGKDIFFLRRVDMNGRDINYWMAFGLTQNLS